MKTIGGGNRCNYQGGRTCVNRTHENYLGEAFLLTVGAFLLAVKLFCLQALKTLIRRTFPLRTKKALIVSKEAEVELATVVSKKSSTVSGKLPTVSKKAASKLFWVQVPQEGPHTHVALPEEHRTQDRLR